MIRNDNVSEKILVLGMDGMDPRFTRWMVDQGRMPNTQKLIERGAARKDLVMLGGEPTVTPPMWATLGTGCYVNVHGITGFFLRGKDLDDIVFGTDSRLCKAEPIWNVFAEAGKKTLVFHWPGGAWPPTSDNPNLMVVDGSAPGVVNMSIAQKDEEIMIVAAEQMKEVKIVPKAPIDANAACMMTDLDVAPAQKTDDGVLQLSALLKDEDSEDDAGHKSILYKESQMTRNFPDGCTVDMVQSPVKEATSWENAPEGAKEFTLLFCKGLVRRVGLMLKNEQGIYEKVAIYKNKKAAEPMVVLELGKMTYLFDEAIIGDKTYPRTQRDIKLLRIDPEGKSCMIFCSATMNMDSDDLWHPKSLYKKVTDAVGYPPATTGISAQDPVLINECMLDVWELCGDWHAKAMLHIMEKENVEAVFSHYHNIDNQAHHIIKYLANKPYSKLPVETYQKFFEDVYEQADRYIGHFVPLLDQDWTILLVSDHGQIAARYEQPMLCDPNGVVTPIMEELGFTVLKCDENGNKIGEIDWTKTKAVSTCDEHIYLNLKGRTDHGIIDPEDQYEVEEEILTALSGYKDPKTGHRVVSVALRNRDAVKLGQGGPNAGDICLWMAERYAFDHGNCLATSIGDYHTSVSPIFVAAGKGIKEGYETDRIIREIDVVPTVAVLGGVRMPAQCEGAPVYQILKD